MWEISLGDARRGKKPLFYNLFLFRTSAEINAFLLNPRYFEASSFFLLLFVWERRANEPRRTRSQPTNQASNLLPKASHAQEKESSLTQKKKKKMRWRTRKSLLILLKQAKVFKKVHLAKKKTKFLVLLPQKRVFRKRFFPLPLLLFF